MRKAIPKEIRDQILARIKSEGIPAAVAAKEAGVNPKTVYGWLAKECKSEPNILEINRLNREIEGLYQLIGRTLRGLPPPKDPPLYIIPRGFQRGLPSPLCPAK